MVRMDDIEVSYLQFSQYLMNKSRSSCTVIFAYKSGVLDSYMRVDIIQGVLLPLNNADETFSFYICWSGGIRALNMNVTVLISW